MANNIIQLYDTSEQPAARAETTFERANRIAEFHKQEARGRGGRWYFNPFRWVDDGDIIGGSPASAYVFFLDLLINRPAEFKAMVNLFLLACNNLEAVRTKLTARQNEAYDALQEAIGQREPVVKYVAQKLQIDKSNASRLIRRADRAKIATLTELVNVYDDTARDIEWFPTKEQITAKMASLPRECAGNGTEGCLGHTRGRFALCWPCHETYGHRRQDFAPETAKWLIPEINRIAREHRELAINELYREHHAETHERKQRHVRKAA